MRHMPRLGSLKKNCTPRFMKWLRKASWQNLKCKMQVLIPHLSLIAKVYKWKLLPLKLIDKIHQLTCNRLTD